MGQPDRSVNQFLVNAALKELQFILFSLVAVKVPWGYKLIFLGYRVAGEYGLGLGQIKTPQSSLVLPRFSHFSLVSASQVAAWLSLISRVLRILASSFVSFMERHVFGGLYSAIFADIILFVFS